MRTIEMPFPPDSPQLKKLKRQVMAINQEWKKIGQDLCSALQKCADALTTMFESLPPEVKAELLREHMRTKKKEKKHGKRTQLRDR